MFTLPMYCESHGYQRCELACREHCDVPQPKRSTVVRENNYLK